MLFRPNRTQHRNCRLAMTLVEMAIVVIVVGGGLFLLAGWMDSVRQEAKRDLAIRLLTDLDRALSRYHRGTGNYPMFQGLNAASQAIGELNGLDRPRRILEAFPIAFWQGNDKRILVDPWGTPLRYYATSSSSVIVEANNGRPIFVSAGPDRILGEANSVGLGDDLRSDDPGPDGFRFEHALREAAEINKEQPSGEKND